MSSGRPVLSIVFCSIGGICDATSESDEEVPLHWWRLFPQRRDGSGAPAEALESELAAIHSDASGLKEKRKRLCDISWYRQH